MAPPQNAADGGSLCQLLLYIWLKSHSKKRILNNLFVGLLAEARQ